MGYSWLSIRGTATSRGMAVQPVLQPGDYPIDRKASGEQMAALNVARHAVSDLELHHSTSDSG
jgi:hypothetical protein